MKALIILFTLSVVVILAMLVCESSASFNSFHKPQNVDGKEGYSRRKQHDKMGDYISRYQDWDEDWSDEDMMQHPIDEAPRKIGRHPGEMCSYSSDCISGCCLLDRDTKVRSCQKKAIRGEKCTSAQVKGDLYVDACPCQSGNDFCAFPGDYCTK